VTDVVRRTLTAVGELHDQHLSLIRTIGGAAIEATGDPLPAATWPRAKHPMRSSSGGRRAALGQC
jgi:hypothetical protein